MKYQTTHPRIKYYPVICLISFLLFAGMNAASAQSPADGTLTFTVRTTTANGYFSPKHVLAIWVEDSQGFVKTRKLRAANRKQYLYTWNSHSSGNTTDAVTGATMPGHETHTVTWDCRDLENALVPDGEYTVYVEFTEEHAQGPLYTLTFTKGTDPVTLTPADESHFKDIELVYEPAAPAVSAAFTYSVSELTVTFTNTSTGADSYSWDFGDNETSVESEPVHAYAGAGIYHVVLTAVAGESSSTFEEDITVSDPNNVRPVTADDPVIYPNPAGDYVIIRAKDDQVILTCRMYNANGEQVSNNIHLSNQEIHLDLSGMAPGLYFVRLETETNHYTYTVIRKD